ncbi:TetR family transcriptional regulator [Phenylobacterium sp. LjRoot225]|uniref:TetR family transcriptional regulator n=1 Tax=Phenylobacterium sp. LjRoot225 TaxID=3342285 RepID=UPI003ED15564
MPTNSPAKQRDAPRTKARILAAAQQAFAELGYSQAGIRDIAAIAGVDSALLQRYFGSKAKLFEAALIDAIPRFEALDLAQEGFGARLTAKFLEAFLDLRAQAMIALSISDPEARMISARVMEEYGIEPLARWLGPPNARTRAIRMTMLSTSFMLYTRQIPLMSPDAAIDSETSEWLGRSLQAIIDER